jgi:hypothetical protein
MFELHAALSELGRRESERGHLDPIKLRDTLLVSTKVLNHYIKLTFTAQMFYDYPAINQLIVGRLCF